MSDAWFLRRGATAAPPVTLGPSDLPPSLDAAYRALAAAQAEEPARWGAWKLGGTNAGTRAAFGVTEPYYGAVARDEMMFGGGLAPARPLTELKGEVEIALRIAPGLAGHDAWCVALEMPASGVANLPGAGVVALVADRCAAGALVLGPVQTGPVPGPGARLRQSVEGGASSEGVVADLTAPPEALLGGLLALARSHGAPVAAGHWVATGGITACLPYRPGDRVAVTLDGAPALHVQIAGG